MSLAWQSTTHRVSQVLPAGPAYHLARSVGLALLVCALFAAAPAAHATLKVVPEGKKGPAGAAASPAPPAAKEPATKDPPAKDPSAKDPSGRDPVAKDPAARDPGAKDSGAKEPVVREREPAPKDSARDHGRRDPVAKDHGGKDAGGREPSPAPRVRPPPNWPVRPAATNWWRCRSVPWGRRTSSDCAARAVCRPSLHQSRVPRSQGHARCRIPLRSRAPPPFAIGQRDRPDVRKGAAVAYDERCSEILDDPRYVP